MNGNELNGEELFDASKELIVVLENCEKDIIEKIPEKVIEYFSNLGKKSNKEFKIDKTKTLDEQKISDACRYLIATLYFSYVADEGEKDELRKVWINNEVSGTN